MKNILLATDFSSNAHTAAICAGEITSRLGGRLIILHALPPSLIEQEEEIDSKGGQMEEHAQRRLDALAKELHKRFGISVSRLVKPGLAEEEIGTIGKSLKVKLAVLGAQGENLQPTKILGRVAKGLLLKSAIPLVCIPPEQFPNFSNQLSIILSMQQQFCNNVGHSFLTELSNRPSLGNATQKRRETSS